MQIAPHVGPVPSRSDSGRRRNLGTGCSNGGQREAHQACFVFRTMFPLPAACTHLVLSSSWCSSPCPSRAALHSPGGHAERRRRGKGAAVTMIHSWARAEDNCYVTKIPVSISISTAYTHAQSHQKINDDDRSPLHLSKPQPRTLVHRFRFHVSEKRRGTFRNVDVAISCPPGRQTTACPPTTPFPPPLTSQIPPSRHWNLLQIPLRAGLVHFLPPLPYSTHPSTNPSTNPSSLPSLPSRSIAYRLQVCV